MKSQIVYRVGYDIAGQLDRHFAICGPDLPAAKREHDAAIRRGHSRVMIEHSECYRTPWVQWAAVDTREPLHPGVVTEFRCARCGSSLLPSGQCSRFREGCQGGWGESGPTVKQPLSAQTGDELTGTADDHLPRGFVDAARNTLDRIADPRCFTCDLRLSECECGPPEPYSGKPAQPPRTWLLWFDHKGCVDEVFTDYEVARKRYEICSAIWSCTLFGSIVGRPAEPVREWAVWWTSMFGHPGSRRAHSNMPLIFQTERQADDCIAGKMDCSPQMTREPEDIRKLVRVKAGPWQDADTSAAEGTK